MKLLKAIAKFPLFVAIIISGLGLPPMDISQENTIYP